MQHEYDTTPEQRALIAHIEHHAGSGSRATFSTDSDENIFLEYGERIFLFTCGSDDDDYTFVNVNDPTDIVHIPLMPA